MGTLVRSLLLVLLDEGVRQQLQVAARETALRFAPSAVADRRAPYCSNFCLRKKTHDTLSMRLLVLGLPICARLMSSNRKSFDLLDLAA